MCDKCRSQTRAIAVAMVAHASAALRADSPKHLTPKQAEWLAATCSVLDDAGHLLKLVEEHDAEAGTKAVREQWAPAIETEQLKRVARFFHYTADLLAIPAGIAAAVLETRACAGDGRAAEFMLQQEGHEIKLAAHQRGDDAQQETLAQLAEALGGGVARVVVAEMPSQPSGSPGPMVS
jgi:hypothetical protein